MSDLIDPTPPPEPSEVEVSQTSERDSALAAVLRHQTERAEVEARARKVRVLRITHPGPPTVDEEESTLRLVMYFQAQKIEQYLVDTGSVPLALDDAGPVFRGMEYIRLTNRDCRILGRTGRVTLSYSSVEALDVFVGTGASVLNLLAFN